MSTAPTPGPESSSRTADAHPTGTDASGTSAPARSRRHTAGLFDIRTIIGALLFVYGLLLLAAGLLGDPALEKTGGLNANLMTALPLLAAGALFVVWARVRPILVPEHPSAGGGQDSGRQH